MSRAVVRRLARRRCVTALALGLACVAGAGCRRDPTPVSTTSAAERADETAADAAPAAPAAKPMAPGSPRAATRTVELAVYTPNAVPPALVQKAKGELAKRFPGLPVSDDPKHSTPVAVVLTPDIEKYAPPTMERLVHFGRGLDGARAQAASSSKGALVLTWFLDADPTHARLRGAQSLAADLAQQSGGFVWDEITRELYSVAAWRKARVDGWEGDIPDAQHHFTIHYYETDGGRHRAISLGLGKLGLPDLVIQDVPPPSSPAATTMLNAVAQLLVEGAVVTPGSRLEVDLAAVRHAGARARLLGDAIEGAARKATVDLFVATPEEGDPDNRLVELRFSAFRGSTEVERATAALQALVGAKPDETTLHAANDPELEAVKARVQAKLPAIAAAFRKGLPLQERVSVKAPFDTDDGSVEWMWIAVTGWEGDLVVGNLDNEPFYIKALEAGAKVKVKQSLVADYLWMKADGTREGGESIPILQRRERSKTPEP